RRAREDADPEERPRRARHAARRTRGAHLARRRVQGAPAQLRAPRGVDEGAEAQRPRRVLGVLSHGPGARARRAQVAHADPVADRLSAGGARAQSLQQRRERDDARRQSDDAYRELAPHPALATWIECYWTRRAPAASARRERVLPDGCVDFVFDRVQGSAWLI